MKNDLPRNIRLEDQSGQLDDDPALNIMNLGASGKKDIAAKHDDYLIDSYFSTAGFVIIP